MQEESGKMTAQEYLGQVEQKIIAVKNMNSGINNLREVLVYRWDGFRRESSDIKK